MKTFLVLEFHLFFVLVLKKFEKEKRSQKYTFSNEEIVKEIFINYKMLNTQYKYPSAFMHFRTREMKKQKRSKRKKM